MFDLQLHHPLFDPDNIAANRRGEITDRQRAIFDSVMRSHRSSALLRLSLGLIFFGILGYVIYTTWPPSTIEKGLAYIFLALQGVCGGMAVKDALQRLRRLALARRLRPKQQSNSDGTVQLGNIPNTF
jgi:hypothetical protein